MQTNTLTFDKLPPHYNLIVQRIDRVRPRPNGPRHFETVCWYVHNDERVNVLFGGERPAMPIAVESSVEGLGRYRWASTADIDAMMLELPAAVAAQREGDRDLEAAWTL